MIKRIYTFLFIFISLTILVECDTPEFPQTPYPRVVTLGVSNISSGGATLGAKITQLGEESIIDHGFVWGFEKNVTEENDLEGILRLGPRASSGTFHTDITSGLYNNRPYYVRAFLKTSKHSVFGNVVEFVSNGSLAPVINEFNPSLGTWGDTVTISGQFFATTPKSNVVRFGSRAAKIIEATQSRIVCIVPEQIESLEAEISVEVTGKSARAGDIFRLTVPSIETFTPASGTFLDEVTITGSNFGTTPEKHLVTIGGKRAEVIKATKTALRVKVPVEVEHRSNEIKVIFNLQSATARTNFTISPPLITAISKAEALIGDEIQLIGENFNPRLLGNEVIFGENRATVLTAAKQKLTVKIPDGFYPDRNCQVRITVAEQSVAGNVSLKLMNPWLRKGITPTASLNSGAFEVNGVGFFIAGNNFYAYDPSANKWTRKADYPGKSRFEAKPFTAEGDGFSGIGQDEDGILRPLWRYSVGTDSWTAKKNIPIPSHSVIATGIGSKGYSLVQVVSIQVYEYDPVNDAWTQTGDELNPRFHDYPHFQRSAFNMDERLFAFFRHQYDPVPSYLYEFDIPTGTWTRRAELMEYSMDGFVINGTGYIKGFSSIHKYDLVSNNLSRNITPLPYGYSGMHYLFTCSQRAYFLGSWENDHFEVWEFDPAYL